jgi:glycylpeptide N-tetradecanoyltransferase
MKEGIADMLVFAKQHEFDVFNCLDLLQNDTEMLKDLLFSVGDGRLHYYLFNWRVHTFKPEEIGIVLV